MSYGMRIWSEDGTLQLDEASFTMRVVLSALVNYPTYTKGVQSFVVAGITPSNAIAVIVPVGSIYINSSTRNVQFEAEILNGSVNVYNYNRSVGTDASSGMGTQRLLVMRVN
jgi:hypothetical protein